MSSKFKAYFSPFLTLQEAEALDNREHVACASEGDAEAENLVPVWRTLVLSFTALFETLLWSTAAAYTFIVAPDDAWAGPARLSVLIACIALTWVYAAYRPVVRPQPTAPYDLFALYVVHLALGILLLGGVVYSNISDTQRAPSRQGPILVGLVVNLVAILVLLGVVVNMPMGIPSDRVQASDVGSLVSPEDYTTLWNWVSFAWIYPLIRKGTHSTLYEMDVWDLSPTMQSKPLFAKFIDYQRTSTTTLMQRLWIANSQDLILDFSLVYVSTALKYAGPYFLKKILDNLEESEPKQSGGDRADAYIYAILMLVVTLLKGQCEKEQLWFGRRAATRIRSELQASIYDKALKRKDFSGIVVKDPTPDDAERQHEAQGAGGGANQDKNKAGADVGKIVTLMSVDTTRIAMTMSFIHDMYKAPFEIAIATIFLYRLLGWSAFAGYGILLLSWPLNRLVMRHAFTISKALSGARDERMQVINELVGAVKFIKFFAWEDTWIQRVMVSRQTELAWIVKSRINAVLYGTLFTFAPIFVSVMAFLAFILSGHEMTISVAFTSITLFKMVRDPLTSLASYIVRLLETKVSLDRIEAFLEEDELVPCFNREDDIDAGLSIANGSFRWNSLEDTAIANEGANSGEPIVNVPSSQLEGGETDHRFEMSSLNVRFPEGKLTMITGPTASGKTALLMALLGEMKLLGGRVFLPKNTSKVDESGLTQSISYAAQSPWIRHQTIKANILFGSPYEEDRYRDVIEACALQPDFRQLEDGDATEIGSRGVNLSGGQKARVALARAIYARTKYVLLDDPLSAVDSHTSRFLFEHLLQGPLLANRTVVLVTHHVELVLPCAYYMVRMLDGRIDSQGTIEELRARGVLESIVEDEAVQVMQDQAPIGSQPQEVSEPVVMENDAPKPSKATRSPRKLVAAEHREVGGVKWAVYNTYFKASWYGTWVVIFVLVVAQQVLGIAERIWMGKWGDAYGHVGNTTQIASSAFWAEGTLVINGALLLPIQRLIDGSHVVSSSLPRPQDHPLFYVGVYTLISVAAGLANVLSLVVQFIGALRASRLLFKRLVVAVIHATMRWHDTTPQGRILNRFGGDVQTLDMSLARSLLGVNTSLIALSAAVLTIATFFPVFLIPAFFMGLVYLWLANGYLKTGRDLRRMKSNSRSLIFHDFGEMLEGLVSVRAFSAQHRFLNDVHVKIDITSKMWYMSWMANRWLLLNFDALGALGVFITTLFSLSGLVDAGIAGVCITSAMAFSQTVLRACLDWTDLELDLNSVERLVEYLDLPQEPPSIIESNRPPAYWPSSASNESLIAVEDLVVNYAPGLPAVIRGVSFQLKAKERIGLLGRTGSGKSTLAMSIMRFIDPVSGRILIDGIDISAIGVHDLRSRLTYIPQDASLISGTLRDNLDPFGDHSDSECLSVLNRVQLLDDGAYESQSRAASRASTRTDGSVSTLPATTEISLNTQVSAGGGNFSQGQKQLIAMARALLRRSPIIIMDEATSSIDFATDAKIQTTIREEFRDSLLLTIAHRLRTVIDYDRLIVLDNGQIAEFDTPLNLINKVDGIFRAMCLQSGTFGELEAEARLGARQV